MGRARLEPAPSGLWARGADRHTARADVSRCFAGDCVTDKGLGVGTEMPLDGDGTMVGDKIAIAVAPWAQTEG